MKHIIIKNGIYGLRTAPGVVDCKTKEDPPFIVSDEEAERLVKLDVAEIVEEAKSIEVAPVQQPANDEKSNTTVANTDTNAPPVEPDQKGELRYTESMKLDDLKKVASEVGVSKAKLKKMSRKKEVIEAINKAVEKESPQKEEEAPLIEAANFVDKEES